VHELRGGERPVTRVECSDERFLVLEPSCQVDRLLAHRDAALHRLVRRVHLDGQAGEESRAESAVGLGERRERLLEQAAPGRSRLEAGVEEKTSRALALSPARTRYSTPSATSPSGAARARWCASSDGCRGRAGGSPREHARSPGGAQRGSWAAGLRRASPEPARGRRRSGREPERGRGHLRLRPLRARRGAGRGPRDSCGADGRESVDQYRQGLLHSMRRYREAGAAVAIDDFLEVRWR
jgi:hypothetical protein